MTWNTIAPCQYFPFFFSLFPFRAHFGPVWILDLHAEMPLTLMHCHPIKTLIIVPYGFTTEINWTQASVLRISNTFKMLCIHLAHQNLTHSWAVCKRGESHWWLTVVARPTQVQSVPGATKCLFQHVTSGHINTQTQTCFVVVTNLKRLWMSQHQWRRC